MWKKPSHQGPQTPSSQIPRTTPPEAPGKPSKSRIGPGLVIQGEVRGQEDLVVEGKVEGKIVLDHHSVVIEASGHVEADISARSVRVAGEVRGNILASEQAVLVETAHLEGDIVAKAVTIETGARFKGTIEMETESKPAASAVSKRDAATPETGVSKPNGSANRVGVG